MDKTKKGSGQRDKLRAGAEERLGNRQISVDNLTAAEAKKLLHELRVHEIELEMQNEELRKAQAELEQSRSRYADLYDFSPVGYVTLDRRSKVLEANLTAADQLGTPREHLMRRNLAAFIVSEDRQVFDDLLVNVFQAGDRQSCELRLKRKDDKIFDFRLVAIMGEGPAAADSCRVVLIDISERKRAEKEQERLRTQQGLQAQKMEAIGTMTGGIAHDFNNIMIVIKSMTALALNKASGDEIFKRYLEPIHDVSERGINLAQQLLIFSQKKPVILSRCDLNDIVNDFFPVIDSMISEDISFDKELEHGLWGIKADKGRIEQVITNLVLNSRDAMLMGGVITLGTENITITGGQAASIQGASPGDFVCLTVEDTGMGMDKETLEHIFEPFFTTKPNTGTGLGLSVVYGIVKELGGWINVSSQPGRGSQFKVYLPASMDAEKAAVQESDKREPVHGGGKRILLVEDDKWVRKSIAMVLAEYGYSIFEASSAEQAISLFYKEKGRFDLVMTDVIMPGKSGIQMVGPLFDINPAMPILLCSGYLDDKAQLEEIVKRGLPYLQKPYEIDDLLFAIEDTIEEDSKRRKR